MITKFVAATIFGLIVASLMTGCGPTWLGLPSGLEVGNSNYWNTKLDETQVITGRNKSDLRRGPNEVVFPGMPGTEPIRFNTDERRYK